jgi:signal recognition particle receptor subunit beta
LAILDPDSGALVLRLVYDGPPSAGKTTSVETLAAAFGRPVFSPQRRKGRTLYFDWMDCPGGRFEGLDVHCQVVTVPGQAILAPRRRALLESADAVVFVCDSTSEAVAAARSYVEGLLQILGKLPGPPVGVLVQANKRDLHGAIDAGELRREVGASAAGAAVIESVATTGAGVREAFDLAVRLALDRTREMRRLGTLETGRPEIDGGPALLERLRAVQPGVPRLALEPSGGSAAEEPAAPPTPTPSRRLPAEEAPRLPEPDVPGHWIWPPVAGRVLLHEVDALGLVPPQRLGNDDWGVTVGDLWRLLSAAGAVFDDLEEGRQALIEAARLHASHRPFLSQPRGLVLAEAAPGRWRLWQITKIVPSLRDRLYEAMREGAPESVAAGFAGVARRLLEAVDRFAAASCPLRANLDAVGVSEGAAGEAVYLGPLPAAAMRPAPPVEGDGMAVVRRELSPPLRELAPELRAAVRRRLEGMAGSPGGEPIAELLRGLLEGAGPDAGRFA